MTFNCSNRLTFSIILMFEYFSMSIVCSASSFSSELCCDWMRLDVLQTRKIVKAWKCMRKEKEKKFITQLPQKDAAKYKLTRLLAEVHDIDFDSASCAQICHIRREIDSILVVKFSTSSFRPPKVENLLPIVLQIIDCCVNYFVYPVDSSDEYFSRNFPYFL